MKITPKSEAEFIGRMGFPELRTAPGNCPGLFYGGIENNFGRKLY